MVKNLAKKIILGVVIILTFVLTGCSLDTTVSTYSYNDFYSHYIFDKSEQMDMSDGVYYIYLYGPECSHCEKIKQDVLYRLDHIMNYSVYLVAVSSLDDVNDTIIDYCKINVDPDSPILTPSLVKIDNHEVVQVFVGENDVISALNKLVS